MIKNPKNYKIDESLGLASVEIKTDPIPSLYALASAGEIEHRDIVLPNVPANREATLFWMKFCEEREGIIYATGNPSFGEFMIEGVQPVHLNIWFDESAEPDVAELIDLLQKTGKDKWWREDGCVGERCEKGSWPLKFPTGLAWRGSASCWLRGRRRTELCADRI